MKALVVSLHDVSPRTHADCERILADLETWGVNRTSLLVIPNHHDAAPILEAPEFGEWLRQLERNGHEIVTHGYYHRRPRQERESFTKKLTTRIYTADEGEFYDIDRHSASKLVSQANQELHQLGVHPRGFIAPAWLLSSDAEEALRELNVAYTTRLGSVLDLETNETTQSQSLVWSVRSGWRRQVSRLWNALLFSRLAPAPLMRISLHPVDRKHPAIWKQIELLIRRALEERTPFTYHQWLTAQHQRAHCSQC